VSWPVVALAGGFAGLDANSFPQVMISRPLVAGTVTGALLGSPGAGFALGALHEVFDLSILPVGAARYPEAGTGTVAATAALLLSGVSGLAAILVALTFALVWERAAGQSVVLFRGAVERLMLIRGQALETAALERRHALAILLDFLRAACVTLVGGFLGMLLVRAVAPLVALPDDAIRAGIAIAAGAALGGTLGVFGGWAERRNAVLLGLAVGGVLLVFR